MQVDHTKNIVELKDVCFSYNKQSILHDISFNIHLGDYLGVIGPNGGGKTTLLKIILGLLKPQCGEVKLFGQDIHNFKDWYKIGYVPQKTTDFEANYPATVQEVVAMGLYGKKGLFHSLDQKDHQQVTKALENVGMSEYKGRLINDLSGGQQQRVFIARALVSNPQVLFLDEPTVGVDIRAQEEFYNLLQKLNKELELTLVLVSHEIDVVANESTELLCVNQTVIYHGEPKKFIKEDYLNKLYGKGVKFILHDH